MTEEDDNGSQNRSKVNQTTLKLILAERSKEKRFMLKVEKLTFAFTLCVYIVIGIIPPFLYHREIIDLYSLDFIKDEVVIGYITAFYISSILASRVNKDLSLDEIEKLRSEKEKAFKSETWGVKEADATSELSAAMKYADQAYDYEIESNKFLSILADIG